MKISHECIHCLARQAVEIAEEITPIKEIQEMIIKKSLKDLSDLDFNSTAPEIAYKMHQHAKNISGINDPYKELKEKYNKIAEKIANMIVEERWIENFDNPFDLACRLSIAGNIIDFSVGLDLEDIDILDSVENSLKKDLFGSGSKVLKEDIKKANSIMFIGDNAGEIIFDKFLINQIPKEKVIYVVKGGPIVNDATMEDAINTGINDLVKVIDNGFDAQGTILKECSKEFNDYFKEADLVISKGQANFETLSHIKNKKIHYLLRAKCISVANEIGCNKMDYVLSTM